MVNWIVTGSFALYEGGSLFEHNIQVRPKKMNSLANVALLKKKKTFFIKV